jgi:hypothetical protein
MAPKSAPTHSRRSFSSGGGEDDYDDAMADVSSTQLPAPNEDIDCTIMNLFESYETVKTYLKEKGAPERVRAELDAMVELVRRVVMTPSALSRTEEAIKTLQHTV